jgi:hypothetical protein
MCHHTIDSKCGLPLLKRRYHAVQISPEACLEDLQRAESLKPILLSALVPLGRLAPEKELSIDNNQS